MNSKTQFCFYSNGSSQIYPLAQHFCSAGCDKILIHAVLSCITGNIRASPTPHCLWKARDFPKNCLPASNFACHEHFATILARTIASLDEFCTKRERNRVWKSKYFLRLLFSLLFCGTRFDDSNLFRKKKIKVSMRSKVRAVDGTLNAWFITWEKLCFDFLRKNSSPVSFFFSTFALSYKNSSSILYPVLKQKQDRKSYGGACVTTSP